MSLVWVFSVRLTSLARHHTCPGVLVSCCYLYRAMPNACVASSIQVSSICRAARSLGEKAIAQALPMTRCCNAEG